MKQERVFLFRNQTKDFSFAVPFEERTTVERNDKTKAYSVQIEIPRYLIEGVNSPFFDIVILSECPPNTLFCSPEEYAANF